MSKRGGKRHGAGRKVGSLSKKTIEEKEALNHLRQRILDKFDPIVDSMITAATGFYYKPIPDSDEEEATRIYSIKPDAKAAKDLIEFVVGKAPQTINNNISNPGAQSSIDALADTLKSVLTSKAIKQEPPKVVEKPKQEEPKTEQVEVVESAPEEVSPESILGA